MNRAILLGALAMLVGCGGDDHPANVKNTNTGRTSTGGRTSKTSATAGRAGSAGGVGIGGRGGAAVTYAIGGSASTLFAGNAGSAGETATAGATSTFVTPAAPVVTITAPTATVDPNDVANVLSGPHADVTCEAIPADVEGATVNVASTRIQAQVGADTTPIEPISMSLTTTGATARFDLGSLPSGPVTFVCVAQDRSSEAVIGASAPVTTYVDHGATIEFQSPEPDAFFALKGTKGTAAISFTVDAVDIDAGDQSSTIKTVHLLIDDKLMHIWEAPDTPGTYSWSVSFGDPKVFPTSEAPDGPTIIRVVATNARGVESESQLTVNVDGTPPTVTWLSPPKNSIVGGDIVLTFEVIDPPNTGVTTTPGAQVNESSVSVTLNQVVFSVKDKPQYFTHSTGSKQYVFTFREGDLAGSKAQATIGIVASDNVANTATAAESGFLYLDNVPPLVDLDPPTVRERYTLGADTFCSSAFDPVGEAANDRSTSSGADYFRALVWDRTNEPPPGIGVHYFSGTKKDGTRLWIQADVTQPLLQDKDGDGYCDAIDEGTLAHPASFISLTPITPTGTSPRRVDIQTLGDGSAFATLIDDTRFWPAPVLWDCKTPSSSDPLPEKLCSKTSDMYRVIRHSILSEQVPAIYGNDHPESGLECTGRYWEYGSVIPRDSSGASKEGWVCMAAEARDGLNNVGISPVHRICFDDPSTAFVPDCAVTNLADNQNPSPVWTGNAHPRRSAQYSPRCPCMPNETYCIPTISVESPESLSYCVPTGTNCGDSETPTNRCNPWDGAPRYKSGNCAAPCALDDNDPACEFETLTKNCGYAPCALNCIPPVNSHPIRHLTLPN